MFAYQGVWQCFEFRVSHKDVADSRLARLYKCTIVQRCPTVSILPVSLGFVQCRFTRQRRAVHACITRAARDSRDGLFGKVGLARHGEASRSTVRLATYSWYEVPVACSQPLAEVSTVSCPQQQQMQQTEAGAHYRRPAGAFHCA